MLEADIQAAVATGSKSVGEVTRMPQVSAQAFHEVERALARYLEEVEATELRPSAKRTYELHATTFVRWLEDDFVPGSRISNRDTTG